VNGTIDRRARLVAKVATLIVMGQCWDDQV
jgi:hypothetical protein